MPTLEDLERVARGGPPAPLSPDDRMRIAAARAVVEEALGVGQRRLRRHDRHRQPGQRAHRGRRCGGAAAQPRALARRRRRARRCPARSCAGCSRCSPRRCGAGTPACARRSSSCCWRCSSATSCPWCRPRARSDRRATSRRWPTSRSSSSARARPSVDGERLDGAAALARAGLEPVAARAQGRARAHQRHAPDGGRRRPGGARRAASARSGDVALALSLEAFKGSTVPFDERLAGVRPQSGRAADRCAPARAARRQRGGGQPRRLRPRAGSLHAALRPAGARRRRRRAGLHRGRARARAARRDRQPARLPRGRRRRGRRQLPRPAAVAAARPPRPRPVRAGLVQRAAHLRAALPQLCRAAAPSSRRGRGCRRADAHAVRGGRAGQRVPGAGPSGRRGVDPDLGAARRTSTRWARSRR